MNTVRTLAVLLALGMLVPAVGLAAEGPSSSDIIFTGQGQGAAGTGEGAALDLEKIDYLLLSEKQGRTFDELHSRTMAALASEVTAGAAGAMQAVSELASLKATADKAYETFLTALRELRALAGVDVLTSGTAPIVAAVAALEPAQAAKARQQAEVAGKSAARVIAVRAMYKQRANVVAKAILASR
jgi:hypothetical protein